MEEGAGVSEGRQRAETLIESLTDKESAQEAYEEMQETFSGILDEAIEAPEDFLDLRTLQSCQKQLALAGSLSREENYQIPVEINGELTAINLKVLHGAGTGKVNVTVQTEEFGQITAKFSLREQKVSGYIACERRGNELAAGQAGRTGKGAGGFGRRQGNRQSGYLAGQRSWR